jgi:hypothetical protein
MAVVPAAPKRRAWLWVLVAVIAVPVLFFGGCAAVITFGSRNTPDHPDDGLAGSRPNAGIGQEVRDGQFAFVVRSVKPGAWHGDPRPIGEFVIVTVSVRDIGDTPRAFFAHNQQLIDTQLHTYPADVVAAIAMNPQRDEALVRDLAPGRDADVQIPFDVPIGTDPATLVLRDSLPSGGVKVGL